MPNIPVTGIYVLSKMNEQFIDPAVVITSYDLMSKSKDMLLKLKFGIVVFVRFCSNISNNFQQNFFYKSVDLRFFSLTRMKATV